MGEVAGALGWREAAERLPDGGPERLGGARGNTPQLGTIYGIDIRQRSTLRAFRQSMTIGPRPEGGVLFAPAVRAAA